MPKIFISHSSRDAALAAKLEKELERLGLPTFNPSHEIDPNQNWRKAILAAIRRADALIVLVASPEAASTSWVGYETGMAEALGKRVIVLASQDHSPAELPADLAASQIVGFDPAEPERAARDIVERLAAA
jgi:nucleoside 2-deoxyribosyltransferase